jgi:hypothetical protein
MANILYPTDLIWSQIQSVEIDLGHTSKYYETTITI